MCVVGGLLCGGYILWFHLEFLFIGVLCGVGGAFCMWNCVICRLSIIVLILFIWVGVPMLWFWWCMQYMCIVDVSILGLLLDGGALGSSHLMVSAAKRAITWVSGNGPVSGIWFWYQFVSGMTNSVMVFESFLAASLTQ